DHCNYNGHLHGHREYIAMVVIVGIRQNWSKKTQKYWDNTELDCMTMNRNYSTIAKWIEDRKRNYPTDANIARKQQAEAERLARGLVIKVDKSGSKRKLKQEDDYSKRKINRHEINEFGGPCGVTDLVIAAEAAGITLENNNIPDLIPAHKLTSRNKKDTSKNIIESLKYIVDNNFFGVVTNDSLKNAKGPLIEVIDQDVSKKNRIL
ncbi:16289_t:CDS:2, partial [Racocetra fulgida]